MAKEQEEEPLWIARLEKHGRQEEVMVPGPPRWYRIVYFVFGYAALAVGLYLLINIFLYRNYLEWH